MYTLIIINRYTGYKKNIKKSIIHTDAAGGSNCPCNCSKGVHAYVSLRLLQQAHWFTAGTLIYTDLQQAHWFTAGTLIYSRHTDLHWFTAGTLIYSRQTERSESLWPSLARTHHLGSSFIPSAVYVIIVYISHALINALSTHKIHINLNTIFCAHVERSPTETIYINIRWKHTHTHTHTHTV